jgi:hypothetical protein
VLPCCQNFPKGWVSWVVVAMVAVAVVVVVVVCEKQSDPFQTNLLPLVSVAMKPIYL